jgi:ribose-phosphate pyrophosphokinase
LYAHASQGLARPVQQLGGATLAAKPHRPRERFPTGNLFARCPVRASGRALHIIGGTASTALAERISREFGNAPFAIPFLKRFPDGELYVRVGGRLEGEDVVLVQSTRTDEGLLELLFLEDAIREAGCKHLYVVIPYFGYARQDRSFFPGEPVSARVMARHVELMADAVVTVDLHSSQTLQAFSKPSFEASGIPAIARLLREHPIDLLVSPDKGGTERAKRMAQILNLPWISLDKRRIDSEHVELALPDSSPVPLDGRNVAIIDDVISTGGTIVEAARLLARQHVASVSAACTHGLFLRDAFERIKAVTHHMYSTDTLDNPAEKVSVAPDIAQILRRNLGVS